MAPPLLFFPFQSLVTLPALGILESMNRRAFSRVDALATACILAVLLALVLVAGSRTRGHTYQSGSLANLHQFAAITSSYTADNAELFWSLSWPGNVANQSQYADLQAQQMSPDPLAALSAQAIDILRRRYGGTGPNQFQPIYSWVPLLYNHLVLGDYLDSPLPLHIAVSPGDRNRLLWSGNIAGFRNNLFFPNQPDGSDPSSWRWSFSSSYTLPTVFFTPDVGTADHPTIIQGSWHSAFQIYPTPGNFRFGRRTLSEVTYPSHKVHMFDSAQWYGRRTPIYWAYDYARVPALLVDGSAGVRVTGTANAGFQPSNPTSPFPTAITYQPQAWEPPADSGVASCKGRFLYTRSGLRGRDFDGPEVPWTP